MGLVDHEGGAEFPYAKKDVFDAVVAAVQGLNGMKLASSDELSGRLVAKAGMSAWSWGETIPMSVIEIAPGRSRLSVLSTPKTGAMLGGAFDMGKNRKNIERILDAVSKKLSVKPPTPHETASANDPAARLAQLRSLLDQGYITEVEFNQKRAEILARI